MELEFLNEREEPKIVRTTLYNDQEFTLWELEILHTPLMQRLYNLKQLGFSDRVFPDAVHSRMNHVLGVAEMADRMGKRLAKWLDKNGAVEFAYVTERPGLPASEWQPNSITGAKLAARVRDHLPTLRLIGLLHDLTHAAYGHTLEDEVRVFVEKHDDPTRQKRFFDALVGQLVYLWAIEVGAQLPNPALLDALVDLETPFDDVRAWAEGLKLQLGETRSLKLATLLRQLEVALRLLMHIEELHQTNQETLSTPLPLLVSDVIQALAPAMAPADVVLHRDAFFVDIVGNTICADLLDYARRDAQNAGLRVQFDERLIRYVCAVSVQDDLSPTRRPCIRLAVQFFTDKMRYDVLSEMSGILKARYLITERVLFHPTKCAAGAMLGTAVQLLGIVELPAWMYTLGDQEFLRLLMDLAQQIRHELSIDQSETRATAPALHGSRFDRLLNECRKSHLLKPSNDEEKASFLLLVDGARNLLWRLSSRRYAKPVFRLRSGVLHSGGENDETIARRYSDPKMRFELEREVERICHLRPGALVIHCPRRKMHMKVAHALVVGSDLTKVAHLRNVDTVTPEPLGPYHDEIVAVENMYRSIWQFHAFLDSSEYEKRAVVAAVLAEKLGFPNDQLLNTALATRDGSDDNSFTLLAGELKGDFPWNQLATVVDGLDNAIRNRTLDDKETAKDRTERIIRAVAIEHGKLLESEAPPQQREKSRKRNQRPTERGPATQDAPATEAQQAPNEPIETTTEQTAQPAVAKISQIGMAFKNTKGE